MDVIYEMKKEMLRRKYSIETIKAYAFCVGKFLNWCHKDIRRMSKNDIKEFLYYLSDKNLSASTLNVHLQALLFAFKETMHKRFYVPIPYSKVPKRLPEVLAKGEVKRIFEVIQNKKHLLMIKLMYSAGLRVSELVHLRLRDLEIENNFGWVRGGKGNKDKMFIIAKKLKQELVEYIKLEELRHDSWLFKGRNGHITIRTIQMIVKSAMGKAGIKKRIHPHTLRHSFATHLIENGYSVMAVQPLMGHKSPETTMTYIHTASPKMIGVESPYDDL